MEQAKTLYCAYCCKDMVHVNIGDAGSSYVFRCTFCHTKQPVQKPEVVKRFVGPPMKGRDPPGKPRPYVPKK